MIPGQIPQNIFQAALKLASSAEREIIFQKGDMVEGKVLRVFSQNQALVRLGGVEMLAFTESKLLAGQSIVGQVEKVSPSITVNLMRGESAADVKKNALMRLLMPAKTPMGQALAKVVSLGGGGGLPPAIQKAMDALSKNVASLMSADLENMTPEKVKDTIKKSGLFMEATLRAAAQGKMDKPAVRAALNADIKAMIGRTLHAVEEEMNALMKRAEKHEAQKPAAAPKERPAAPPHQVYELRKTAPAPTPSKAETAPEAQKRLDPAMADLVKVRAAATQLREAYANIELNQLLNSSAREREGAPAQPHTLYQLAFFNAVTPDTARVYVRPQRDKEGGAEGEAREGRKIVFMLDMSRLGPVRVDVSVGSGYAKGTVYTVNESTARYLRDSLPSLLKPLEEAGFRAVFDVSAADEKFVTEQLENYTPITAKGLVDLRA